MGVADFSGNSRPTLPGCRRLIDKYVVLSSNDMSGDLTRPGAHGRKAAHTLGLWVRHPQGHSQGCSAITPATADDASTLSPASRLHMGQVTVNRTAATTPARVNLYPILISHLDRPGR